MNDDEPTRNRDFTSLHRTITERQKRLLEELVEIRYANESEALRAAIENLHQKAVSDAERPVHQIYNEVSSISSKVEDVESDVSELLDLISAPSAREVSPDTSSTDIDPAEQDSVYKELNQNSPATVEELAEGMDLTSLAVRKHIGKLEDMALIETLSHGEGATRYRPRPAGGGGEND